MPKLAGWNLNDSNNPKNNDGLFQVLKAVEAAEATIKQQVDENNRLRTELQKKILEVEKYRSGELKGQTPHSVGQLDHLNEADGAHPSTLGFESQLPELRNMDSIGRNLSSNLLLAKDPRQNDLDLTLPNQGESQTEYSKVNGTSRAIPGGLTTTDNSGVSHFSSPSASFSPNR